MLRGGWIPCSGEWCGGALAGDCLSIYILIMFSRLFYQRAKRSGSHLPVGPLNNVWPYIVVSGWLAGLAFFWWSGAVVEGQRIGGPQSLPALQKQGAQFAGSFFAAVTDSAE